MYTKFLGIYTRHFYIYIYVYTNPQDSIPFGEFMEDVDNIYISPGRNVSMYMHTPFLNIHLYSPAGEYLFWGVRGGCQQR